MKITIDDHTTVYLADPPTSEDIASLLIWILPSGQGRSPEGRAERRALVLGALEALDKASVPAFRDVFRGSSRSSGDVLCPVCHANPGSNCAGGRVHPERTAAAVEAASKARAW